MMTPRRKAKSRKNSMLKTWLFRLVLSGVSVLLALAVCEVGLRLFFPQQLVNVRPDIWQPVEGLGWQPAPNLDTTVNTGEGEVRFVTDGDRMRVAADAGDEVTERNVLALGDSFTEALQVDYEETFTARLADKLSSSSGNAVGVANTGVGGWGPSHYLIKLKQELAKDSAKWDAVAVYFFLGNDVEDKRVESFAPRESSVRRFAIPRKLSFKEIKGKLLYPINNVLETRSHLFSLVKNRGKFLLMRVGLSAHYFPKVLLKENATSQAWEISADVCAEIVRTSNEHDLPVVFLLVPGVYMVDEEAAIKYANALSIDHDAYDLRQASTIMGKLLKEKGVDAVDLTDRFKSSGGAELFGKVDTHLSPKGHEVVAMASVEALNQKVQWTKGAKSNE